MSGYQTRGKKRVSTPPPPPPPIQIDLATLVDAIEGLRQTTQKGFDVLAENNKNVLAALSQTKDELRKSNKKLDKAIECMISMDETLLDMAVDQEIGEEKKKKHKPDAPTAHVAAPLAHTNNNMDLFFKVTDPLQPPVQPPQ